MGLGSPIISDDAIGLKVVQEIDRMGLDVDVQEEPVGGTELIPMVMDYDLVVIVDAIQTRQHPPGSIYVFDLRELDHTIIDSSGHDVNIATAMAMGRHWYPDRMPEEIHFVAIEAADLLTVSEEITPEVAESIPEVVSIVLELIGHDVGP